MTEKKDSLKVLIFLWGITLVIACALGLRAHQISEQKAENEFYTLNTMLVFAQCVLANTEVKDQWNESIIVFHLYPFDIDNVTDQGDNREIVSMLNAMKLVYYDHPNREEVIMKLKELQVSRDSRNRVFTVVKGDAEVIAELCIP